MQDCPFKRQLRVEPAEFAENRRFYAQLPFEQTDVLVGRTVWRAGIGKGPGRHREESGESSG